MSGEPDSEGGDPELGRDSSDDSPPPAGDDTPTTDDAEMQRAQLELQVEKMRCEFDAQRAKFKEMLETLERRLSAKEEELLVLQAEKDVALRPFHKNQASQCSLLSTAAGSSVHSALRRTSSVPTGVNLSATHQSQPRHPHYTFHEMIVKKPETKLGLRFDADELRPPVLSTIEPDGYFARSNEVSKGDRLLLMGKCAYCGIVSQPGGGGGGGGTKVISMLKYLETLPAGSPLRMTWLRKCRGSSADCCSEKCLALRDDLVAMTHRVKEVEDACRMEEMDEKKQMISIQKSVAEEIKRAQLGASMLNGEVDTLREAFKCLQTECEQRLKRLKDELDDRQSQLDSLMMNLQRVDASIPGIPLDTVPLDPSHFRAWFEQHRNAYRRHLMAAISDNNILQSNLGSTVGEMHKLRQSTAALLASKDAEISALQSRLAEAEELSRSRTSELDEVFVKSLTLEDEVQRRAAELESVRGEQQAVISSHQNHIQELTIANGQLKHMLEEAMRHTGELQAQNSNLKVQLSNNERSLQELQRSMHST